MGSQLNTGQNQPQATPPPPPGSAIFVLVNNKQEGPFNLEQLKSFIQNVKLLKKLLLGKKVWHNGTKLRIYLKLSSYLALQLHRRCTTSTFNNLTYETKDKYFISTAIVQLRLLFSYSSFV
ncbi:MAG: hypothetical protein R2759_13750 [Bacteroidales bacterium]